MSHLTDKPLPSTVDATTDIAEPKLVIPATEKLFPIRETPLELKMPPKFAQESTDKSLPMRTCVPTDKFKPAVTASLTDAVLPNVASPITESSYMEPTVVKPRTDKLESTAVMSATVSRLLRYTASFTDRSEPI
jgi:hypothetical protein